MMSDDYIMNESVLPPTRANLKENDTQSVLGVFSHWTMKKNRLTAVFSSLNPDGSPMLFNVTAIKLLDMNANPGNHVGYSVPDRKEIEKLIPEIPVFRGDFGDSEAKKRYNARVRALLDKSRKASSADPEKMKPHTRSRDLII